MQAEFASATPVLSSLPAFGRCRIRDYPHATLESVRLDQGIRPVPAKSTVLMANWDPSAGVLVGVAVPLAGRTGQNR